MAIIATIDTETISTNEKKFCYNVGYVIADTDSRSILCKKDFVVEQIWHNRALFETAYYADKRPLYVSALRGKRAIMDKWGYIMRELAKDFREHKVEYAYAFNSPFDDSVFTFNCDWFKTNNPLDTVPVLDIRGMVSQFITNDPAYLQFCEDNKRFTDSGNYSANAETVYQYITANHDFVEAHTALADSEIETEILFTCLDMGAEVGKEYEVTRALWRNEEKPLVIKVDNKVIYSGKYRKKYIREGLYSFKTEV
jgi:hypothetical protein